MSTSKTKGSAALIAAKFDILDRVRIIASGEEGEVVARCEYLSSDPTYLVRYCNAQGQAVEVWWVEDSLQPVL